MLERKKNEIQQIANDLKENLNKITHECEKRHNSVDSNDFLRNQVKQLEEMIMKLRAELETAHEEKYKLLNNYSRLEKQF